MSVITLRKALGVLAKSSSFSVTTVTERKKDVFDELKQRLFVKQQIESDLEQFLNSTNADEIIFLCGSSGDGKSEILTRLMAEPSYKKNFDFHLDATHSFAPQQSAIDALDELFSQTRSRPLLIGINTGMLANYAKEGAEEHQAIRSTIENFLSGQLGNSSPCQQENCFFFDFEHYPKFEFDDEKQYSSFIKRLLENLTEKSDKNLFYTIAKSDELNGQELRIVANFNLLSKPGVQDVLITQLFKARLMKDQFVTTRALLDLIHHLLLGPGYLFDNLFVGVENELVTKIAEFDPARLHTHELDQFILRYEIGLVDSSLDGFLKALKVQNIHFERENAKPGDATSLIRLFWLLRYESLGNDYHSQFSNFFNEGLFERYVQIWHLHKNYTGQPEQRRSLQRFYATELIAGIQRYANRKAPELSMQKEEFFLGEFGGVKITAPVALKPDWDAILNKNTIHSNCFDAYLKVGQKSLLPVSIGLNLFELVDKLNNGYRPNKYDKNAIILLDEIVDLIIDEAKLSTEIKFYIDKQTVYTTRVDDDMITISGKEG